MIVPRALHFLDLRAVGFLPRQELRDFLSYASKVQATGLTNIVTTQADTFIVGGLLSVNAVAVYVTGANFATQLRAVPMNALGPISIALSRAYGQGGDAEAVRVFTRLQRRWVQATTGWTATAVGAAYFGVSSWLGPQFRLSGVVACILVAANGVSLWAFTLLLLLGAVGRPGIETRFAVVAVALNLALTVPLVLLFGVLGTVSATAVGGVVGSVYLVRLARSRYDPALRSFFRDVPVLPAVLTMTTVVLLELLVRPVVPRGALGLIVCGVAAAPGLVVFTLSLLGPRTALSMARQRRLASFSA
jgi:O-antigen/teichoic acid export membrane protein